MARNAMREEDVNKSRTLKAASRAMRNAFNAVRAKSSSDADAFLAAVFAPSGFWREISMPASVSSGIVRDEAALRGILGGILNPSQAVGGWNSPYLSPDSACSLTEKCE